MNDGWDLVREDYGEVEALARVPRDAFRGISIIPRLPPGQVRCRRDHTPSSPGSGPLVLAFLTLRNGFGLSDATQRTWCAWNA